MLLHTKLRGNLFGDFNLGGVALIIVESNYLNLIEVLNSPYEAGGAVLSAAEYNKCFFIHFQFSSPLLL
ncbi:hypothetical protein D3C71_2176680 [compost metagenome]